MTCCDPQGRARFGKFVLVERLAHGGMAEVHRAILTGPASFAKTVALKRMLPVIADEPDLRDRFIAEARMASDLNHCNIVQVYEFGEFDGRYYLASELVDGLDCARLLSRARAGGVALIDAAAFIVAEAARGLAYAHAAKQEGKALHLVHRDVSPQNILVSRSGDVKITDFGIAKVRAEYHTKTGTGILMGKLRYLSPEQVAGLDLDGRSDLFALGLVLWELIVGRQLIDGDTPSEVVGQLKVGAFAPPSTLRAEVPAELDHIVTRALSRDRAKRYQSGNEMARDLDRLLRTRGGFGRAELAELLARLAPNAAAPPPDECATTPALISWPEEQVTARLQDKVLAALREESAQNEAPILLERKRRRPPGWMPSVGALVIVAVALTALHFGSNTRTPLADASVPPDAVDPAALRRCREGDRMLAAGDAESAAGLFRQALAIDSRATEAHLGLGRSAALLGDTDVAVASFRAFLTHHPDGVDATAARRWLGSLTARDLAETR